MSWEKSTFVLPDILRLFVNTLTTNDMYSRRNMQNFPQHIEAPLSEKQKNFSGFFIAFLKWAYNLERFEKNNEYPSLLISEIIDFERSRYLNV